VRHDGVMRGSIRRSCGRLTVVIANATGEEFAPQLLSAIARGELRRVRRIVSGRLSGAVSEVVRNGFPSLVIVVRFSGRFPGGLERSCFRRFSKKRFATPVRRMRRGWRVWIFARTLVLSVDARPVGLLFASTHDAIRDWRPAPGAVATGFRCGPTPAQAWLFRGSRPRPC
jgi:hypothetical protein